MALCIYTYIGGNNYWLGNESKITLKNLLTHILLLHGLVPHYCNSILGVEWYLGVIAIFYLLVPYLYKKISSLEKSLLFFIICLFISNIWGKYYLEFMPEYDGYIYRTYAVSFSIIAQLPVIALGIILYYILNSSICEKVKHKRMFSLAILFVAGALLWGEVTDTNQLYGISVYVRHAIYFMGIIISLEIYPNKFIDNKLFQCIGKHSYSIYLYHFLLIYILEDILCVENLYIEKSVIFLLTSFLSFLLAWILEKYVNSPIQSCICARRQKNE